MSLSPIIWFKTMGVDRPWHIYIYIYTLDTCLEYIHTLILQTYQPHPTICGLSRCWGLTMKPNWCRINCPLYWLFNRDSYKLWDIINPITKGSITPYTTFNRSKTSADVKNIMKPHTLLWPLPLSFLCKQLCFFKAHLMQQRT